MELQTKCQCGEKLMADVKVEDGVLVVEVESCAKCIARAIVYSEDTPWLREKYLKEGGML